MIAAMNSMEESHDIGGAVGQSQTEHVGIKLNSLVDARREQQNVRQPLYLYFLRKTPVGRVSHTCFIGRGFTFDISSRQGLGAKAIPIRFPSLPRNPAPTPRD